MSRDRKPAILVVEDDSTIARGLEELLRGGGYRVTLASSGEEGLRIARSTPPAAVVLDIHLPGIDGLQVCTALRADGYKGVVMCLTAAPDSTHRAAGLQAGTDDYLQKPFDGRKVLARIRVHLREKTTGRKQRT